MNSPRFAFLCAFALACLGSGSRAANFYPIVFVTSSTQDTDLYSVLNLIEGPGIGFGDVEPHDRLGATWVTSACSFPCDYLEGNAPPVLVFDLETDVDLSEISVWGYAVSNANGVKEFTLRFATHAEGEAGFGTSITYNPTFAVAISETSRQSLFFDRTVKARFVELTCTDNYFTPPGTGGPDGPPGGDRVGLGEVAFEIFEAPPQPNLVAPATLTIAPTREVTESTVVLQNIGAAPLTIGDVTISGPGAAAFMVVSKPVSLPTLQSGNLVIRFTPGAFVGDVIATLTIASNDGDSPMQDIAVMATVLPPLPPAVDYFPIVNVTASTQDTDLFPVINLIQGVGEGFAPDPPYDQLGGGITHRWVTDACGYPCDYLLTFPPPVIILDLGQQQAIGEIDVWGYTATNDNGVKEFQLRFATDAEGEANFGTSITYSPVFVVDQNNDILRFQFPFNQVVTARYVEFTCLDNFFVDPGSAGGDRFGLGEIAFPMALAPNPSSSLAITAVERNPATRAFTLTFTSETGKTYTIERSTNLAIWIELASDVPSAGTSTSYVDSDIVVGDTVLYYRVTQP